MTDAHSRLAQAKRAVAAELAKQGTPGFDPRTYERLIEAERKAAEEARAAAGGNSAAAEGK
ncbi:MAG: translation initiation factor 2 [Micrococcales bacterium]|nr:translation initiation factor 2 [Micrococcales bacterium]